MSAEKKLNARWRHVEYIFIHYSHLAVEIVLKRMKFIFVFYKIIFYFNNYLSVVHATLTFLYALRVSLDFSVICIFLLNIKLLCLYLQVFNGSLTSGKYCPLEGLALSRPFLFNFFQVSCILPSIKRVIPLFQLFLLSHINQWIIPL